MRTCGPVKLTNENLWTSQADQWALPLLAGGVPELKVDLEGLPRGGPVGVGGRVHLRRGALERSETT